MFAPVVDEAEEVKVKILNSQIERTKHFDKITTWWQKSYDGQLSVCASFTLYKTGFKAEALQVKILSDQQYKDELFVEVKVEEVIQKGKSENAKFENYVFDSVKHL